MDKRPAGQRREHAERVRERADIEERRSRAESDRSEAEGFRMLAREAWDLQNRYFAELAKVRRVRKLL